MNKQSDRENMWAWIVILLIVAALFFFGLAVYPAHSEISLQKTRLVRVSHKKTKAKRKIFVSCVSLYGYKYQMEEEDLNKPQFLTATGPSSRCQVVARSTI